MPIHFLRPPAHQQAKTLLEWLPEPSMRSACGRSTGIREHRRETAPLQAFQRERHADLRNMQCASVYRPIVRPTALRMPLQHSTFRHMGCDTKGELTRGFNPPSLTSSVESCRLTATRIHKHTRIFLHAEAFVLLEFFRSKISPIFGVSVHDSFLGSMPKYCSILAFSARLSQPSAPLLHSTMLGSPVSFIQAVFSAGKLYHYVAHSKQGGTFKKYDDSRVLDSPLALPLVEGQTVTLPYCKVYRGN